MRYLILFCLSLSCFANEFSLYEDILNQGELEFSQQEYGSALHCFEEVLHLISLAPQNSDDIYKYRAAFGQAFSAMYLQHAEKALTIFETIEKDWHCCTSIQSVPPTPPIVGPDTLSIDECIDNVDGTARYCGYLVTAAPISPKAKMAILAAVEILQVKARKCCRAGGLWKACVGPLTDKWWKFSHKFFPEPVDPAWD